jgi:hypothetical protein
MIYILLAILIIYFLLKYSLVNIDINKSAMIKSKDECIKEGGDWNAIGIMGIPGCQIPAKDVGKLCSDSSQCQYHCINHDIDHNNKPTSGVCSKYYNMVGNCFYDINNGKADEYKCLD